MFVIYISLLSSSFDHIFFFSSRRRHTRCALVTGFQTCALPISLLNPLKRSHQIEKRLVVLARDDAPVGKAAAVHIGLDTKIDRMILISSTQEICMQRVDKPLVSE